MSSGFSGGADFYNSAGIGRGSASINNGQVRYRSQLGGILLDGSSTTILPRRTDMVAKRPFAELEIQQQQQLGTGAFLRSVKQRSYHHASPISPLSPVDFSSPDFSSGATAPCVPSTLSGRYGIPLFQQLRSHSINPNNNNNNNHQSNNPSLLGLSFGNCLPPNTNRALPLDSEPESEKKMRNRLQELEKQLLDDIDEDEGDAGSVITNSNSEWSETANLITTPSQNQNQNQNQKPLSPSPASSSSSSSSSSASPSSSSSKQSLLDAAAAISEGKMDAATATLARLKQVSNARGDPEQRLTAYMVSALQSRGNPAENHPPVPEVGSNEHVIATQMLYEASPCFKLGFMAANLAILEATRDQPNNVHVVDFDIGQGSQYMTLIHALAERQSGKPIVLKITTVIEPGSSNYNEDGLRGVGEGLRKLAERLGVNLKFNAVSRKMADLDRDALGSDAEEALAVNFAFRLYRMPDESVSTENPRDQLLRLVKKLCPRVVTLVEQEMNTNTAPFGARVSEACAYYGALFDSLDATRARDDAGRVTVEEYLGRKAANTVACEGRERLERCEVFGKWRARMGMAGFEASPLSQQMAESLRVKLSAMIRNHPGFTVKQEGGGICFGWMGRVLTVASAWR